MIGRLIKKIRTLRANLADLGAEELCDLIQAQDLVNLSCSMENEQKKIQIWELRNPKNLISRNPES